MAKNLNAATYEKMDTYFGRTEIEKPKKDIAQRLGITRQNITCNTPVVLEQKEKTPE